MTVKPLRMHADEPRAHLQRVGGGTLRASDRRKQKTKIAMPQLQKRTESVLLSRGRQKKRWFAPETVHGQLATGQRASREQERARRREGEKVEHCCGARFWPICFRLIFAQAGSVEMAGKSQTFPNLKSLSTPPKPDTRRINNCR